MITTNTYSDSEKFFQLISDYKEMRVELQKHSKDPILKRPFLNNVDTDYGIDPTNNKSEADYLTLIFNNHEKTVFDFNENSFNKLGYLGQEAQIYNSEPLKILKIFVFKHLETDKECFINFKSSNLWSDKETILKVIELSESLLCYTDFSKIKLDEVFLSSIKKISDSAFSYICFRFVMSNFENTDEAAQKKAVKEFLFAATKIDPQYTIMLENFPVFQGNEFADFVGSELLPNYTSEERRCLYDQLEKIKNSEGNITSTSLGQIFTSKVPEIIKIFEESKIALFSRPLLTEKISGDLTFTKK